MSLTLLGAIASLLLWVVLIFVIPVGPTGSVAHLLLGLAGALFVRWWALRPTP